MKTAETDILIKALTLLYRETLIENMSDTSTDLVKEVMSSITKNTSTNQMLGEFKSSIDSLLELLEDYITNPDTYDKSSLLQSLGIIFTDNPDIIKVINKTFDTELEQTALKNSVLRLRHRLRNYVNKLAIKNLFSKASYDFRNNTILGSVDDYVTELIQKLEGLTGGDKIVDKAIVDELDIGLVDGLAGVVDRAKEQSSSVGMMKTGFKELNDMFQGGWQRGKFIRFDGLPNNYKSGMIQSLVCQLPRHNIPYMLDPTKKPLIVLFSFEDDSENFLEFMYRYLYNNEFGHAPDLTSVTSKEVADYIHAKLTVNGYHVKLLRINPSEWTYKSLFNKLISYEAEGYEIHACLLDYLSKLPTTGCVMGAAGVDLRDLFNRVRAFCSAKKILVISPHQISGEGKALLRAGEPAVTFVKAIAEKGFTEGSKQLDQIVDGEFYIHKATINRKWVLTLHRGKHRISTVVDDDKKYAILHFPYKAPIRETVGKSDDDLDNIPMVDVNESDELSI